MQTVICTAIKAKAGFYPAIIIRNPKGQCIGSVKLSDKPCSTKTLAVVWARLAARTVERTNPNVRFKR